MARIDGTIFGYRRITVDKSFSSVATSRLLRSGISAKLTSDGTFTVRERDREKALILLRGIEYSESECLGLLGAYRRIKYKPLVFSLIIFCFFMAMLLEEVVWDVRVSGSETMSESELIAELEDAGLGVGMLWTKIDRSFVETKLLSSSSKIAWVNINRRGSVAYVSVVEKEIISESIDDEMLGYANVVASQDCIIEEITVERGTAVVKKGDAVKRGELLISGTLPAEAGGGFCYADGTVVGRVSSEIITEVERKYEKQHTKSQKIIGITLKIFKMNANIFKRYGNLGGEYDIIKEIKVFSLFGKARLPITLSVDYLAEYESEMCEYTDTELVSVALSRLALLTNAHLSGSDLLKIRTSGEFTERGYAITNNLVYTTDVGVPLEFSIEHSAQERS